MLYMRCPSCRELLADKQKYYERMLAQICQQYENGELTREQANAAKEELVNSIGLQRWCCRMRIISFVRIVDLIK